MEVCGGACGIDHLVQVAIPAPDCGGVLSKYVCRWSALHPGVIVFPENESFGLALRFKPCGFLAPCTTLPFQVMFV